MRHSAEAVVVMGDRAAAPIFSLKAMASIIPEIFRGSSTPTFTRATTAYDADWENRLVQVLAGEPRFTGARRVQNAISATSSQDMRVSAGWSNDANTTVTYGSADPLGGNTATKIVTAAANVGVYDRNTSRSGTASEPDVYSVWMKGEIGGESIKFGGINDLRTITLTTAWVRYSAQNAGANSQYMLMRAVNSGTTFYAWGGQHEIVTGQSNQNPSEYVSVGVLSAPYHGAGVDGVQYFATLNGNTVSSNVVTEAAGLPICPANGASSATTDANGPLGYLAEGARTNLCLQSQTFSNAAWTTAAGGITSETVGAADPTGGTGAYTILLSSGGTVHLLAQAGIPAASGAQTTCSIYAKKGTNNCLAINIQGGSGNCVTQVFDLANGVLGESFLGSGSGRNLTASITPAANGFYRCVMSAAIDFGASNYFTLSLAPLATGNTKDAFGNITFSAAGTETIILWGAQVEAASFASTYIPTTTVAVTRNGDALTYAASGNISGIVGSCYAESKAGGNTDGRFLDSVGGIPMFRSTGALYLKDNASEQLTQSVFVSATGAFTSIYKIATAWGGSISRGAVNGTAGVDASFNGDLNLGTSLYIGGQPTVELYGTIRNVRIYGTALSAAQLQAMTA